MNFFEKPRCLKNPYDELKESKVEQFSHSEIVQKGIEEQHGRIKK